MPAFVSLSIQEKGRWGKGKYLSTQALTHLALLLATVDGHRAQSHSLGILQSQRTETTTGADDGDGLAGAGARLLQALVDGQAGAQDGGDGVEGHVLGDLGGEGGLADGVLLEGAVDGVAGQLGVGTERLLGLLAELARQTRAVEPLEAGVVADLKVVDQLALGDDDARALVPAHQRHLHRQRPVALHGVQVGVAHARVADLDEDLVGGGLAHGDFLVHGRAAFLLDHLGPLFLGDGHGEIWGCCCCCC